MKLTANQHKVLSDLRKKCRENVYRYKDREYLYGIDCAKLARGDQVCVFGIGAITSQIGRRLGMKAGAVLSTFKALERKNLVIRETSFPDYQRPLYWWPVGLAAELHAEIEEEHGE